MTLTKQQEAELLTQYNDLIWKTVHRFERRSSSLWREPEDLYQECAIAFIKYVRTIESLDVLKKSFPFRQMTNAMCLYCLSRQTVTVPMRTANYSAVIRSMEAPVDYAKMEKDNNHAVRPIDDCERRLDIKSFIDGLPDREKKIIHLRMQGVTNREVAQRLGLTDCMVSRSITAVSKSYHEYIQ